MPWWAWLLIGFGTGGIVVPFILLMWLAADWSFNGWE